jgi:hypothetical protein
MSFESVDVEIQFLRAEIVKLKARMDGLSFDVEELKRNRKIPSSQSSSSSGGSIGKKTPSPPGLRTSAEMNIEENGGMELKASVQKKRKIQRKSPRTLARAISNLPNHEKAINNPIASLSNYCKHYLSSICEFEYSQLENKDHQFEIYVNGRLLYSCSDRRKALAKENAAVGAIEYLRNNMDALQSLFEAGSVHEDVVE